MTHDAPSTQSNSTLHPAIYRIIIAVTVFWVVASAMFLDLGGYSHVVLGVVGVFAFMTLAIPLTLRRIARHHGFGRRKPDGAPREDFSDWLRGGFDVWGDYMTGSDAAILILTIFGAVVIQATAFVVIFRVIAPH